MTHERLLWVHHRAEDVPSNDLWLSDRERAILDGLRFAPRRRDWRLGRWTAKHAVSAWLGPSLPTAEIIAGSDGAPDVFVACRPAPVAISLTHRSGLAVCVVAPEGSRVGCDLEAVATRSDTFLHDWFTPAEVALVEQAGSGERALMTSLVWSAKESALKCLREGLRVDTREVVVHPGDLAGEGWRRVQVEKAAGGCPMTGWWRVHAGHVLTIVNAAG
jgi:4'-phosphopantetheinyl transferase